MESIHPILQTYLPVVQAIGETMGKQCEVVLHQLTREISTVIAIANGEVTGRQVGSPATDLLIEIAESLESGEVRDEMLLNYRSETPEGRILKSSTVLIRDGEQVIGALCINQDITDDLAYLAKLKALTDTEEKKKETHLHDAESFMESMIDRAIAKSEKPLPYWEKEDRLRVVAELEKRNVFSIRGAVSVLAAKIKVSKFSIYNYIEEVRTNKEE